jgi:hypothetical protein
MLQCKVCGRSGSDVAEHKSTLSKNMTNYCMDCLFSGREPYEDLVNFGWEYGWFNKPYQQKIILPTLVFNNKTVQQFNEEVRQKRDEKDVTVSTE